MRIVSYNMLHDKRSKSNWTAILDECDPDIVLAQESLTPDAYRMPLLDEDDWQGNVVWCPVNGLWGSAVYLKSHTAGELTLPEYGGWVVGVELQDIDWLPVKHDKLLVFSLHAPTGQGEYAKVVNSILDMIGEFRNSREVVIGGDFNLTVSERQSSEERKNKKVNLEIQNRLRDEFALINCWQTANPGVGLAQTLRWTSDPKQPYHCDGIFVPASWSGQLRSCQILSGPEWDGLSDHNPVVAEFD